MPSDPTAVAAPSTPASASTPPEPGAILLSPEQMDQAKPAHLPSNAILLSPEQMHQAIPAPSSLVGPTMSGVVAAPQLMPDLRRLAKPLVGGIASAIHGAVGLAEHPIDAVEGLAHAPGAVANTYWHSVEQQAHNAAASWSNGQYLRAMGYFALGLDYAAGGKALKDTIANPLLRAGAQVESGNARAGLENFAGNAAADATMALGADSTAVANPAGPEFLAVKDAATERVAALARRSIRHVDEIAQNATREGAVGTVSEALRAAQDDAGYSVTLKLPAQGKFERLAPDTDLTGHTFYHGTKAPVGSVTELDAARGEARSLLGPGTYLTDDPVVARSQGYAGPNGQVLAGTFAKRPNLINADAAMSPGVRATFESFGRGLDDRFELPADATPVHGVRRLQKAMNDAGFTPDEAKEKLEDVNATLAKDGYDGYSYHGGVTVKDAERQHNAIMLFQTKQDRQITDLMRTAAAPRGSQFADLGALSLPGKNGAPIQELRVPVTAQVGNPGSLGGKATNLLGKSFFGAPIEQIRNVQNVLGQRVFQAMLGMHADNLNPADFIHSPVLMGRAVSARVLAASSQLYQTVDDGLRGVTVTVPLEATEVGAQALDQQTRIERLAAYVAGEAPDDMQYQAVAGREALAMRQRAARVVRTTANDADAFRASRRVEALDKAIEGALTKRGGSPLAWQYRQASELWHDGSAIERQINKIAATLPHQLDPVQAAVAPRAARWDWTKIGNVVNDPTNESDLLRLFKTPENLQAFRQFADLAAKDGSGQLNKLAVGIGSLFLGNYPLYRAVWGISSANPSYLASTGAMMAGYRIVAQLATEPAGAVIMRELMTLGQGAQDAIRLGYAAALAGKIARGGELIPPQSRPAPGRPQSNPTASGARRY